MIVGLNLSDIMEVRHDGLKETSDYSLHLKKPNDSFWSFCRWVFVSLER